MSPRQRRLRRRHRRNGGVRRGVLVVLGMAVIGAFAAAASVVGYIVVVASDAPDIQELKPVDQGASSEVFASNGRRLGFIENDEVRQPVTTGKLPTSLKQATIAIEDERFYKHKGVDYEGVVRAAIKNLRSGETVQGGSTLTMQLVRNIYPIGAQARLQAQDQGGQARPGARGRALPRTGSSPTTSTACRTGPSAGSTAIGAEAAARVFFDKPASKLTLPEAATARRPAPGAVALQPVPRSARRARAPQRRAAPDGEAAHDHATPSASRRPPRRSAPSATTTTSPSRESYFFDYVKEQLIERYGLRDRAQGRAEGLHDDRPRQAEGGARGDRTGSSPYSDDPSSAIVSIDPRNGYIRAMASSADYRQVKFNFAAQGHRQPGSTFKVMVLMAALRKGIEPEHDDVRLAPLNLNDPVRARGRSRPTRTRYGGSMNLVTGDAAAPTTPSTRSSTSTSAPTTVRQAAYDMGITTKLDGYPAEGLGGLRARRLAAGDGERLRDDRLGRRSGTSRSPIKKVVLPGRQVRGPGQAQGASARFSDGTAWEATKILEQNIQRGTGHRRQHRLPGGGQDRHRSTTAPTPGSSATRPSSRRRSGSAIRTRRCRCSACTGSGWPAARFPPRSGTTTWRTSPRATARDFQRSDGQRELPAVLRQVLVQRLARAAAAATTAATSSTDQNDERLAGHRPGRIPAAAAYDPDLYETQPQAPPQTQAPSHRRRRAVRHKGGGKGGGGGGKSGGTSPG